MKDFTIHKSCYHCRGEVCVRRVEMSADGRRVLIAVECTVCFMVQVLTVIVHPEAIIPETLEVVDDES